ncbi:MAG: TIR domain-containing protein [Patescibacteria group bacterium]
MKDLHVALKNEIIGEEKASGVSGILVKHQQSKTDIYYSLHIGLSSMSVSGGIQQTDFAARLGFQLQKCAFQPSRRCYAIEVPENFDYKGFIRAFEGTYSKLRSAQGDLNKCGIHIDGDEGLAYFFGKKSTRSPWSDSEQRAFGDAHRAGQIKKLKETEDDVFKYVLTWMENGNEKGWTIHYLPKHPPMSSEVCAVMNFFKLGTFSECLQNNFNPCRWKFIKFNDDEDSTSIVHGSADRAHSWFNSHQEHFGKGLQCVVEAEAIVSKFGLHILEIPSDSSDLNNPSTSEEESSISLIPDEFDIAISFAAPDRKKAKELATIVKEAGYNVFYDDFYTEHLWGKDLPAFFHEIYSKKSRYCVMMISPEYVQRMWTNHERQCAQSRAIKEQGKEYILPIQVEFTEVPGLPDTVGYLSLEEYNIQQVADMLISKLKKN